MTGVQTDRDEIACGSLVIATGAWTACSVEWFNTTLPVSPLRGQMLSLQQPSNPLRHIIFGNGAYLVPRGNSILVGATKDEAGFDVQVTEEGISWLHATALKLLPALRTSNIERTWAGLRPKTPDSQPILGSLPNWENVTTCEIALLPCAWLMGREGCAMLREVYKEPIRQEGELSP